MKKFILLTLLVSVLIISLAYAGSQSIGQGDSAQINATFVSQSPDPVEPGQVVTAKFKIENEGKSTIEDVIVKIVPKFPFTIYNDATEKNIGKLRANSIGANAVEVGFKLKVDEEAVEEETEIELMIKVAENVWKSYTGNEFLIDIETHDAVLDITSITSEPKQIAPGETADVSIMVKNQADSLLKDIKFKLEFDNDLPLAPYQSSSERRIAQLKSNYQNSLAFKIIADPEAVPGLYKIPLNISYNDEKGNSYSTNDILAVTIGEIPKIRAYVKKSTVLQAKEHGKITLEIANAGSSDLKFLELYILPSDDYHLVSTSNYFYLGDVDSDDTESEEIDVYINKVKVLHLPIQLKYADANNKPFQQQFDLEMNLYSTSELKKYGVIESSTAGVYVLVIVLIIASFILYRYRKKNPEKFSKLMKKLPFLNNSKKK